MKKITVNKNDASQRLDKFLSKYLADIPRAMLYKSIRKNCVRVNGRHMRDEKYILREGDVLTLYFKDEFFRARTLVGAGSAPPVVYEDENIIIMNKPKGMPSHADDKGTKNTLADAMKNYLYSKGEYDIENEHSFSPALCSRLDRNTSGLVIGAKNAAALRIINEKIRLREIKKFYLCVVDGVPPESGYLTAYLTRGDKKVAVSDAPSEGAKQIKTRYRRLTHGENASLCEIELETGRTHQIRAQMAHIGYPLRGDKKYGSKSGGEMTLISYKLKFEFTTGAGELSYLSDKEVRLSDTDLPNFSDMNL